MLDSQMQHLRHIEERSREKTFKSQTPRDLCATKLEKRAKKSHHSFKTKSSNYELSKTLALALENIY